MNNNTFQGIIEYISPVEYVGEKQNPKITIVIKEVKDEYPQKFVGTIFGKKNVDYFNAKLGDEVIASINFSANESKEGKWFGNSNVWKVEVLSSKKEESNDDDLPF